MPMFHRRRSRDRSAGNRTEETFASTASSVSSSVSNFFATHHHPSHDQPSPCTSTGSPAAAPKSTRSQRNSSPVLLPHTITERFGGRELWVKAPVLEDQMTKQCSFFRKMWKQRLLRLNGRQLSYYDLKTVQNHHHHSHHHHHKDSSNNAPCSVNSSTTFQSHHPHHHNNKLPAPKGNFEISPQTELFEIDDVTFEIRPNAPHGHHTNKPWILRAKDEKTKLKWLKAITDCIDISTWLQHYHFGDVLGAGGNGIVKILTDTRTNKQYAVKIVDASRFKDREAIVAEIEILRQITNSIDNDNLVHIYKVYEENDKIFLVLQLCQGGELYHRIVHQGKYCEQDALEVMKQLLQALQALHNCNILHLDLKPENILFATNELSDNKIILTDFGLARMINQQVPTASPTSGKVTAPAGRASICGTVGYIAPEVITSQMYTPAADVFSAGVILYILLVGYPPFRGDSEVEILLNIARGRYEFKAGDWEHISPEAKDLVMRMLQVRMQERITMDEIFQHPWLQEPPAEESNDAKPTMSRVASSLHLKETVARMEQYNFQRKSKAVANFMNNMLVTNCCDDEGDNALEDFQTIEQLIKQITPLGKISLQRASSFAKALGISGFIDSKRFVEMLDRNKDGFIDAQDFCECVHTIRNGKNASFGEIIFDGLWNIEEEAEKEAAEEPFGIDELSDEDETRSSHTSVPEQTPEQVKPVVVARDETKPAMPRMRRMVTRQHFEHAFDKLQCPEQLAHQFFEAFDAAGSPDQASDKQSRAVTLEEFLGLLEQFPFVGKLFLDKAKTRLVSMTHSSSSSEVESDTLDTIENNLHQEGSIK